MSGETSDGKPAPGKFAAQLRWEQTTTETDGSATWHTTRTGTFRGGTLQDIPVTFYPVSGGYDYNFRPNPPDLPEGTGGSGYPGTQVSTHEVQDQTSTTQTSIGWGCRGELDAISGKTADPSVMTGTDSNTLTTADAVDTVTTTWDLNCPVLSGWDRSTGTTLRPLGLGPSGFWSCDVAPRG